MARRAAILDRDGTLIEERHYLRNPDDVKLIDGAVEALRLLASKGFLLFVVSNQSGLARGLITPEELDAVDARFRSLLLRSGVRLDGCYYCKHGPDDGCDCRKPKPGLVPRHWKEERIDFASSYVIGDKDADLDLAKELGATGILVLTGHGTATAERLKSSCIKHLDILQAARSICL